MALGASLVVLFGTAAKCSSSWLSQADNAIQRAPIADDILRGGHDLGSLRGETDDLLRTAPKQGGAETQIESLTKMMKAFDDIQKIDDAADAGRSSRSRPGRRRTPCPPRGL